LPGKIGQLHYNAMKILTVVGARPQFIKAAVVSHAIERQSSMQEVLVHTGQHFDANMSAVFFSELGIPEPAHTLAIHSLPHGAMTGRMIEQLESVLQSEQPDWVLVYGDTNSTLAGALAAVKMHIPVAHVEAGLRSFNRQMPEEINRVATDHIANRLYTPTRTASEHLKNEGILEKQIVQTGDVMYDCALRFGQIAEERSTILEVLKLQNDPYILCTAHRAETTASPELVETLFSAIALICATTRVAMPIHPRMRTTAAAQGIDLDAINGLQLIGPVGYLDMVRLEQRASLILTDSGGIQKEAYFHGIPCVTMRPQTEWIELVEAGWNVLSPLESGANAVAASVASQLGTHGDDIDEYGDGDAASRIVSDLLSSRS